MPEKSTNGAKHRLTDEQLRELAEVTLQHAHWIERLFDLVYELKLELAASGVEVKNLEEIQRAVNERAKAAALLIEQRNLWRKSLGLD